jgi:hypothetical protein
MTHTRESPELPGRFTQTRVPQWVALASVEGYRVSLHIPAKDKSSGGRQQARSTPKPVGRGERVLPHDIAGLIVDRLNGGSG